MTDTATVEPGGTGLLDNVQVSDQTTPTNPQAVEIDHRSDTTAATSSAPTGDDDPLERPDFWPENFWKKDSNEPDLEGIAKSWSDLRKHMVDPAAEMKQLGPNGGAIVNGMVDWARGLVNKGVWSKDDFEEFKIMGGTARGITALMKVREAYEGRVPTQSAPLEGAPSKDELYQMVNDPRYKTDPGYRTKVEKMFQASFK
jgi:hypothetical protein